MRVVAGLGNPGPRYVRTRHNAGFMVVRKIAERWGTELLARGDALLGERLHEGQRQRLVLPQGFMNRSGNVLRDLVDDASGEDFVAVYDDVDLPVGALRVRGRGGSGGHRGVASIIEECGADFIRVRVGVGRPPENSDTADYVLADLSEGELEELVPAVERAADAVECVLEAGLVKAMNHFNGDPTRGEIEGDDHA